MGRFRFLMKDKISKLPECPGVYAFKQGRRLLYIGKAANIRKRIKNHFKQPAYRNNLILGEVEKIGFIKTGSEIEALLLEAELIKRYQPKFNIIWRDDKNYFYVGITKEDYPRVYITHQTKSRLKNCKLKINYIGPFVDGKALKQTLKVLRKIFPYRSCKKLPNKPCLWYQLSRCPAPCLLKSSLASQLFPFKAKIKRESQKNAKSLIMVLRGKKKQVLSNLKKEMKRKAEKEKFEEAAKIRNRIFALEKIIAHSKILVSPLTQEIDFSTSRVGAAKWAEIEKKLKKILKLKNKISRIEAYDISNIQGQQASGAQVTFVNGKVNKNFYRRFRVKIAGKPNDVAMIKEILERRFRHPEWQFPDLILIDGGRAQLNVALQCLRPKLKRLKQPLRIMALAKKRNNLYIEGRKKPILLQNLPREIFNLILQLRDEAHRFAQSYYHKLRENDFQLKTTKN